MAWTKEDRSFKTLINRRTTDSTGKFWYNEFSDNTLNVHILEVWTQAINADPATAVSEGAAEHRVLFTLTLDGTVPSNQAYYAFETGARLKDWISTKYGEGYLVHLYDNNNAEIFPTDACQWFFDYQTGILTFNGSTAAFTKPFKISGYRFIGTKGSGASGTSGTSGSSGAAGTSGTSGAAGAPGTSGSSGVDGTSGSSGAPGAPGTSGSSGIDGTSGSSGAPGTSGSSGAPGTSGSSGIDGTSGSSGIDGTSGSSGAAGAPGAPGTSGSSGIDGTSGTSGAAGAPGTSGSSGIDGTSGSSGADGADGADGTSGSSGIDGTSGSSGAAGAPGTSGSSGIDGTSGSSGAPGAPGTSGSSGIDGTYGSSGISGTSGTSGANDGTIPLGDLPSGEIYDGLVVLTETDQVNQSINWINEVLTLISPVKPGMLTGQTLTLTNTTRYSAKVPTGLASAWYDGGVSAGDTVTDYVVDNTFTLTSPSPTTEFYNGMYNAPGGTLQLYAGVTSLDSISTATTGSSTYLTVSSVATYNSIWSKANAFAGVTQATEGYKSYTFQHTLAGNSNALAIRYDNVATSPTFSAALTIAENSVVTKYLSGIQYYGQNTTLDISYTGAAGIFTKCYHPTAVAVISQNVQAFANFNQNPGSTPAYNDPFAVSSYTVSLSVANKSSNAPTITVTLQKPTGVSIQSSANLAKNLCTYGTASTTIAEYFFDEAQRLVLNTNTAWTSTATLVDGNAQDRNGYLQWPNATECPGFVAATQEYQRKFTKASASTGSLTLAGAAYTDVDAYGTGDLNILLQLDTDGQYFDLGRVVGSNNGNGDGTTRADSKGGRSSGSAGVINWSIGTYSTADNSSQYRIIIIFRNATHSITSIVSA